jgi:hypothetical protein
MRKTCEYFCAIGVYLMITCILSVAGTAHATGPRVWIKNELFLSSVVVT